MGKGCRSGTPLSETIGDTGGQHVEENGRTVTRPQADRRTQQGNGADHRHPTACRSASRRTNSHEFLHVIFVYHTQTLSGRAHFSQVRSGCTCHEIVFYLIWARIPQNDGRGKTQFRDHLTVVEA